MIFDKAKADFTNNNILKGECCCHCDYAVRYHDHHVHCKGTGKLRNDTEKCPCFKWSTK